MSGSDVLKKTPYVTYSVIGLCVLVYLWELVDYHAVLATLVEPIASGGVAVLLTLFTMTLVHARPPEFYHIVFNLLAFSVLGRLIEAMYGPVRLTVLLIALAWVSSAAQVGLEHVPGIGISGVVYGIFGFMIGASPRNQFLWWFVKKNALMLIGWAVLSVFLTQSHVLGIANVAHFAGLFYGAIYGFIYGLPRYRYAFLGLTVLIPIILGGMLLGSVPSDG